MSSDSNQGYLSSEVDLFVSSTGNSVHVVMRGISVGWIGFSYAKGIGLSVAGVILLWRYWSFCHEGTDLWGNVSNYLFVLGP